MTEFPPSAEGATSDGTARLTIGQLTALAGHRDLNERTADVVALLRTMTVFDPEPTHRAVAGMMRWAAEQTRADMNQIAARIVEQFTDRSAVSESLTLALATLPRPELSTLQTTLQEAGGTPESWAVAAIGLQLLAEADDAVSAPDDPGGLVARSAADILTEDDAPGRQLDTEPGFVRFAPEDVELLRKVAESQAAALERAQASGRLTEWVNANAGMAWLIMAALAVLAVLVGAAGVARDYYDVTTPVEAVPVATPSVAGQPPLRADARPGAERIDVDRGSTD